MTNSPYEETAHNYLAAGFTPLPLPYGQKNSPPIGYTGHKAQPVGGAEVQNWIETLGPSNICLRMDRDLIGIDVDHYDGKNGHDTLTELEARLGKLPATWISTSRTDGLSGIRFFRTNPDITYKGIAGPGIEIAQGHHRYVVASPSRHPAGGTYTWNDPNGGNDYPRKEALPYLPFAWEDQLTKSQYGGDPGTHDITIGQAAEWLERLTPGMCEKTVAVSNHFSNRLTETNETGEARHDIALSATWSLTHMALEGHTGVGEALEELKRAWNKAIGDSSRNSEFTEMLKGSISAVIDGELPGSCDCSTLGVVQPERDDQGRVRVDISNRAKAAEWLRSELGAGALSCLFSRDGRIVHTPRIGEEGYLEPDSGSSGPAQVRELDMNQVKALVDTRYGVGRWVKAKEEGQSATWTPALLPVDVAMAGYYSGGMGEGVNNLRELRGVTHTPTIRPDGTILSLSGYDDATKLLYLPDSELKVPTIPNEPTRNQIRDARETIDELIGGFPFTSDSSKASYIGLMLTPILRPLLPPPYPLAVITAPTPGSGKSFLAQILRALHGGSLQGPFDGDNTDVKKEITATLATTTGAVIIRDNVRGVLRYKALEALLSSASWSDRMLGQTKESTFNNDRLWVVTGNNATIGGDLERRTLGVSIDPGMPNPERRLFQFDPVQRAIRDRGRYLAALLTLARGWVAAKRPATKTRSDDYAVWSASITGILKVAGVDGTFWDPADTKANVDDSEVGEWSDFLEAIEDTFGAGQTFYVSELVDKLNRGSLIDRSGIRSDLLPGDLAFKFSSHSFNGSGFAKSLGRYLNNRRGQYFGNRTLKTGPKGRTGIPFYISKL